MSRHIIKYEYDEGCKLVESELVLWCGADASKFVFDFKFQDAQHALLAIEQGSSIAPCSKCLNAIKKLLEIEKC